MLLVVSNANYADEFDCNEFCIFDSRAAYDKWLGEMKERIEAGDNEFYFGTNEQLIFESIEDLEADLKVHEITEQEAAVFKKFFPNGYFGTGGLF